jgi:hypothetical protein
MLIPPHHRLYMVYSYRHRYRTFAHHLRTNARYVPQLQNQIKRKRRTGRHAGPPAVSFTVTNHSYSLAMIGARSTEHTEHLIRFPVLGYPTGSHNSTKDGPNHSFLTSLLTFHRPLQTKIENRVSALDRDARPFLPNTGPLSQQGWRPHSMASMGLSAMHCSISNSYPQRPVTIPRSRVYLVGKLLA